MAGWAGINTLRHSDLAWKYGVVSYSGNTRMQGEQAVQRRILILFLYLFLSPVRPAGPPL